MGRSKSARYLSKATVDETLLVHRGSAMREGMWNMQRSSGLVRKLIVFFEKLKKCCQGDLFLSSLSFVTCIYNKHFNKYFIFLVSFFSVHIKFFCSPFLNLSVPYMCVHVQILPFWYFFSMPNMKKSGEKREDHNFFSLFPCLFFKKKTQVSRQKERGTHNGQWRRQE